MNWKHIAITVSVVLVVIFALNKFVPSVGAMIFGTAAAPATATK